MIQDVAQRTGNMNVDVVTESLITGKVPQEYNETITALSGWNLPLMSCKFGAVP